MKLASARLHNFRQFEGESSICFSTNSTKPVTVFHGANGGGKTTLLNALTWCLCGEFTPNFSAPSDIVSYGAIEKASEGSVVDCFVEVEFDHQQKRYIARRSCKTTKRPGGTVSPSTDVEVSLRRTGPDGETKVIEAPQRLLERIIPASLISFFFFDGERIEALARPNKAQQKEVANATRSLMGVEVITRAIGHLRGGRGRHNKGVKRMLEDELEKDASDRVKELLGKQHELEGELEDKEDSAEQLESEARACREEIEEIDARLRQLAPAAELQKRRDHIGQTRSEKKEQQKQNQAELRRIVAEKGHLAPLETAARRAVAEIEDLKLKGHLPAGIKKHFVDGLIAEGSCICKRPLEAEDGSLEAVEDWRNRAGLADIESRALGLAGQYQDLDRRMSEFRGDLDDSLSTRREVAVELDRLEEEYDEVSAELQKLPQEDVVSLEKKRTTTDARAQELRGRAAVAKHEAQHLRDEIAAIEKDRRKEEERESKSANAQRRLEICQDALAALERLQKLVEDDVREQLQNGIQDVFGRIAFKGYRSRLNEDYSLALVRPGGDGTPVAMSAGESQVLSLSFITSIIDMLSEKNSDELLGSRSPYPMVMDSPFGTLDKEHRAQVAKFLPKLAPQVVLLASETQWEGAVREHMTEYIGAEYVITFFSASDEVKERSIQRGGREYRLVAKSSSGSDCATITEVLR